MTYDTISDAVTMQPGAEGTLLAGRYRIVRQLGQGGMGSVWLAEDTQLDGKLFAIKMLPSILVSNKRAYRQLKDEALVAMKLTHPNIVTLRAFEENNGNPFLVMDYIEGQTLDDYLAEVGNGEWGTGNREQGTGNREEVIRLLKPIAAALDYAHSKGVVHRDVKPGNVMIAKDGTPYILDFGIAREIQETMTRVTGKLSSGTLLYMSPEQLNGDAPKPAQDVYSFAAMVYECLKGEPPFSRGNIEFQIMNKMPAPLDPHFAKSGSVMQGLAKRPEDRPPTCVGVLEGHASPRGGAGTRRNEDVRVSTYAEATVDREHVERVETGMSPSPRPPKRNIAGTALPIICTVAALLVLGGGLWYRGQQRKQAEWRRIVAAQKAEEAARQRAAEDRRAQEEAARRKAEDERKAQKAAQEKRLAAEKSARDRDRCIANLKQIETAIEHCLMGGEIPTPERLFAPNRYFRNEPTCPLGGHYKINKSDTGYTVVCPHADEGHRLPLSGAPNIIKANWEKEVTVPKHGDAPKKVQLWEDGPYWADRNIGAEKPEDYGYYFWWGDTVGYKRVNDTWVASDGSSSGFSFDENVPTYGKNTATLLNEGWITADDVLSAEDDAARVQWGGEWRMPTQQEMDDLCKKCDWKWTTMNGVRGYIVRGRGGYASDSIFLPCAGYGLATSLYHAGSYGSCWSSGPSSSNDYHAWYLNINSGDHITSCGTRYGGQSVRPVQGFTK